MIATTEITVGARVKFTDAQAAYTYSMTADAEGMVIGWRYLWWGRAWVVWFEGDVPFHTAWVKPEDVRVLR